MGYLGPGVESPLVLVLRRSVLKCALQAGSTHNTVPGDILHIHINGKAAEWSEALGWGLDAKPASHTSLTANHKVR